MIVCKRFRKKKIVAVLNYINTTLGGGIKMQLIYFAKREFIQRLKTHVLLTNLAALESVQLCSLEKMTPFLLSDQLSLCNSTGVTVPQASLHFGHPHFQNPSQVIFIVLSLGFWECRCSIRGDAPITVALDNQQPYSQAPFSSSEEHRGPQERGQINQSWQVEPRNYKQNTTA